MPETPKTAAASPTRGRRTSGDGNGSGRQAELLEIAANLFAERGYVATTVRDIAEAAGILSGSLYHHFDSKESMVDEIVSTFLTSLLASYDEILARGSGPRETLQELARSSLLAMDEHRAAIVIYQNEAAHLAQFPRFAYVEDARQRFATVWLDTLRAGAASGELRSDLDANVVYHYLRDVIWTASRWFRPDGPLTTSQIADQYLSMLLDGIAT